MTIWCFRAAGKRHYQHNTVHDELLLQINLETQPTHDARPGAWSQLVLLTTEMSKWWLIRGRVTCTIRWGIILAIGTIDQQVMSNRDN